MSKDGSLGVKKSYLDELRDKAPSTTYNSHHNFLTKIDTCYQDTITKHSVFSPEDIQQVFFDSFEDAGYEDDTIACYASTFANLLAFDKSIHPNYTMEVLSRTELSEEVKLLHAAITEIKNFLEIRAYGTRTHVYVCLLTELPIRPSLVREIDSQDITNNYSEKFERDMALVNVPISRKFLVRKLGMVDACYHPISPETMDVIQTYCDHEREATNSNQDPLLTSCHGRVSQSSLRKNLRAMVNVAEQYYSVLNKSNDRNCAISKFIQINGGPPTPYDFRKLIW